MMKFLGYSLTIFILLSSLVSCTGLMPGRSYISQMSEESEGGIFEPYKDFPVVGGDNGRYWYTEHERKARTPASFQEHKQELEFDAMKSQLTHLESTLPSEEQVFYNEIKDKMKTDSEKIYYLELPNAEERISYADLKGWNKSPEKYNADWEKRLATRQTEISLGMTKQEVMDSAGRPERVEIAGNPRNENERWIYSVAGDTKFIYFEAGRVEGWSSDP